MESGTLPAQDPQEFSLVGLSSQHRNTRSKAEVPTVAYEPKTMEPGVIAIILPSWA